MGCRKRMCRKERKVRPEGGGSHHPNNVLSFVKCFPTSYTLFPTARPLTNKPLLSPNQLPIKKPQLALSPALPCPPKNKFSPPPPSQPYPPSQPSQLSSSFHTLSPYHTTPSLPLFNRTYKNNRASFPRKILAVARMSRKGWLAKKKKK